MGAEAVVVLNPDTVPGVDYLRKSDMQLASKMRFISAQLVALLTDDLWLRNARHSNAMAARLYDAMTRIDGVTVVRPAQANSVFAILPADVVPPAGAVPLLHLGSGDRRGPLDVFVGHHRIGHRHVRDRSRQGDGSAAVTGADSIRRPDGAERAPRRGAGRDPGTSCEGVTMALYISLSPFRGTRRDPGIHVRGSHPGGRHRLF